MKSYWIESINFPKFSSLNKNITCDVCIVGGGITGITLAYLLSKKNIKVALLEKDRLACSTTGNTTAKVTSQHGLFYSYLENSYGIDYAKRYLEANENAILDIENIINAENINCDFEMQDSYVFTEQTKYINQIKDEQKTLNKLGFNSEYLTSVPLPIEVEAAIKFPNQAQFHPRKYLHGLINCIKNNDGLIFENSTVVDIKKQDSTYTTFANNYSVSSKYVVMATKYPFINIPGFYFMKMYQSTSYAIAVETSCELFNGIYINVEVPTMSFRTIKNNGKRLLLIAGSDHKTGAKIDLSNAYDSLEDIAKKMYPDTVIKYKWNTEDCISLDKLPYVGVYSNLYPNMFVATGFKKWGITTSNIAAHIICDNILGIKNINDDLFTSTRVNPIKNSSELKNMIKESTYSLVINKCRPVNDADVINNIIELKQKLPVEQGKIFSINGKKVGVYKDKNDTIFAIKPICSHLGCELSFNNISKTWDCPCHGSRFDYKGNCIYGPSVKGLAVIDLLNLND